MTDRRRQQKLIAVTVAVTLHIVFTPCPAFAHYGGLEYVFYLAGIFLLLALTMVISLGAGVYYGFRKRKDKCLEWLLLGALHLPIILMTFILPLLVFLFGPIMIVWVMIKVVRSLKKKDPDAPS